MYNNGDYKFEEIIHFLSISNRTELPLRISKCFCTLNNNRQHPFNSPLSGTTQLSRYQKKHSPAQTYLDHQPSFVSFLQLLAVQFTCLTVFLHNLQVLFGLLLDLKPSTPYSSHCLFSQHMPILSQPSFAVVPKFVIYF